MSFKSQTLCVLKVGKSKTHKTTWGCGEAHSILYRIPQIALPGLAQQDPNRLIFSHAFRSSIKPVQTLGTLWSESVAAFKATHFGTTQQPWCPLKMRDSREMEISSVLRQGSETCKKAPKAWMWFFGHKLIHQKHFVRQCCLVALR